jgi:hypothetical protein
MATEKPQVAIHNAITGEIEVRDMTAEEIATMPKATDETPTAD